MLFKKRNEFIDLEDSLDDLNNPFENLDYHLMREFTGYTFSVAIPREADKELKKRLYAALKSYALGFKSVDYVLKRYGKAWDFNGEETFESSVHDLLIKTLKDFLEGIYKFTESIKDAHNEVPLRMGLLAADTALQRCISSFEAIAILLRRGYWIESNSLLRIVLEQIAWSLEVFQLEEIEEIEKIKPESSIKGLKKLYPNAGKIYGYLSEYTHLNAKKRGEFYGVHEEKDFVLLRSKQASLLVILHLLKIADLYALVYEMIHLKTLKKPQWWKKTKGSEYENRKGTIFNRQVKVFLKKLEVEINKSSEKNA